VLDAPGRERWIGADRFALHLPFRPIQTRKNGFVEGGWWPGEPSWILTSLHHDARRAARRVGAVRWAPPCLRPNWVPVRRRPYEPEPQQRVRLPEKRKRLRPARKQLLASCGCSPRGGMSPRTLAEVGGLLLVRSHSSARYTSPRCRHRRRWLGSASLPLPRWTGSAWSLCGPRSSSRYSSTVTSRQPLCSGSGTTGADCDQHRWISPAVALGRVERGGRLTSA